MTDSTDLQVSSGPSGLLHETPMAMELATEFGLNSKQVINVLRTSIIKVPKDSPEPTAAELLVVMSVMQQLHLNPMMKQLHAWRDKRGDMAVMVGYDGWVKFAKDNPTYRKVSFKYGPRVSSPDGKGKEAYEWVQATVHDSVFEEMEMPPTYLTEWYQPSGQYPGPWQKQTSHKICLIAFRQAIRTAYGISGVGIGDIEDMPAAPVDLESATGRTLNKLSESMRVDEDPYTKEEHEEIRRKYAEVVAPWPESEVSDDVVVEIPQEDEGAQEPQKADFVPCGTAGCPIKATVTCKSCKVSYCKVHAGKGGLCKICEGGK